MNAKNNFYLINCVAAALVWLCCNLHYFSSYVAMFVIWLPLFLFDIFRNRRLGSFWLESNILLYVLCYFISIAIGVILVPHKGDGIGVAIHLFWFYPIVMLGYLKNKCPINKGILYGIELTIITGFLCSLVDIFYWEIDRPRGLMYNCILWASFMSFMLPIFVYGARQATKKWQKCFRVLMCVLILANLLLTRSRGVILASLIVGVLLLIFYGFRYYRKYTLIGLSISLFAVYWFYANHLEFLQRSYDGDRWAAWYASVLMFKDHPLFGVGFMQWKESFATVYAQPNVTELLPHAHNMYLGAAASTGIVGLLGLFTFLGGWIKIAWQQLIQGKKYYAYTLIGIAIFLVHGLFDYVLKAGLYEKVIWLVVFIYQFDIFENDVKE